MVNVVQGSVVEEKMKSLLGREDDQIAIVEDESTNKVGDGLYYYYDFVPPSKLRLQQIDFIIPLLILK
jgi:hypothetical protein